MNTLTPNRILQQGDQYHSENGLWHDVPEEDYGLQIQFTKYGEVRRPSEKPFPAPNGSSDGAKGGDRTHSAAGNLIIRESSLPKLEDITISPEHEKPKAAQRPSAIVTAPTAEKEKTPAPTPEPLNAHIDAIAHPDFVGHEPPAGEPFTEAEKATARAILNGQLKITFPKVSAGSGNTVPIWTGRNGTFSGYGLECMKLEGDRMGVLPPNDHIMLSPIGKRGIGNCCIQFPVSVIPELVDWLEEQAKPYKT